MANVEAFIWHDAQGNIVSVGHVIAGTGESIQPMSKPDHQILKLQLPEEHLQSLHLTHSVNVKRRELCPRREGETSERRAP